MVANYLTLLTFNNNIMPRKNVLTKDISKLYKEQNMKESTPTQLEVERYLSIYHSIRKKQKAQAGGHAEMSRRSRKC